MAKTLEDELQQATAQMQDVLQDDETVVENTEVVETEASTESDASTASDDVKSDEKADEVDEDGIPYKNRYKETVRKMKRMEEDFADIKSKLDTVVNSIQQNSFSNLRGNEQLPTTPVNQELSDEFLDQPATRKDVLQITHRATAKERNDRAALDNFPDLANPTSALYKETFQRIEAKRRMGIDPTDPMLVLETASAAYGDLVRRNVIKVENPKADERNRRANVDAAALPTGRSGQPRTPSKSKMSPVEKLAMDKLTSAAGIKMTEDDYLKIKARRGN